MVNSKADPHSPHSLDCLSLTAPFQEEVLVILKSARKPKPLPKRREAVWAGGQYKWGSGKLDPA
ncbi:hypothetical protein MJO28_010113 [Puccinia striiformis f. sp. tritici]|uniref:Uncharacterized protein n=1 Tax=Puccinia striiformis f. sp. tritici TaxID=168172 RepID=A0ACC0E5I9_9BASI|nr:hypothetical protein MJO28_010113 [Puccinia striiformis f. sp. tritici]